MKAVDILHYLGEYRKKAYEHSAQMNIFHKNILICGWMYLRHMESTHLEAWL